MALFHFGFVLLFLLFVVAFEDFVAGEFVEGAVFVHEEDVVAVAAGGDDGEVFVDAVFAVTEGFWDVEGHVFEGVADAEGGVFIDEGAFCGDGVAEGLCNPVFVLLEDCVFIERYAFDGFVIGVDEHLIDGFVFACNLFEEQTGLFFFFLVHLADDFFADCEGVEGRICFFSAID